MLNRLTKTAGVAIWLAAFAVNAGQITSDVSSLASAEQGLTQEEVVYTAFSDRSWAITSRNMSDSSSQKRIYERFIEHCVREDEFCEDNDQVRLRMNAEQPGGMKNYTKEGFKKLRAPAPLFKLLKDFWDANKDNAVVEIDDASCYHNSWEIPTTIVKIEDTRLVGGGWNLSAAVWSAARDILEEWTGQKLAGSSVYGIRIYHNQSILTPHCDRLPLVSSAIINIDQDVDEPWFLEVYGHDGKATNVTMEPGDIVLYESHSVIHGRPYPLSGKFYANIFVHFETMGDADSTDSLPTEGSLPPYVKESYSESYFRDFPRGWTLLTDIMSMVQRGDLYALRYVVQRDASVLTDPGSQCDIIRMAGESKHKDILEFLTKEMNYSYNMNCRSRTPLDYISAELGEGDPLIDFMVENGAQSYHDIYADNTTSDNRCDVMYLAVWYPSASRFLFAFFFGVMRYDPNMVCRSLTPLDLLQERFDEDDRIILHLKARGGLTYNELVSQDGVPPDSAQQADSRCDIRKAAVLFGYTDVFDLLIDELNYDLNADCDGETALDLAYETWDLDNELVTYLEDEDGRILQEHSNVLKRSGQSSLDERCSTLERAIANHDLNVVKFLVTEMRYSVNMACEDDFTPLDLAFEHKLSPDHPLVLYLLEQGAELSEDDDDDDDDADYDDFDDDDDYGENEEYGKDEDDDGGGDYETTEDEEMADSSRDKL